MVSNRPLSVTWLVVGVLIFTSRVLTRLGETITLWPYLQTLPLSTPPVYFLLSSVVWSGLGIALAWGLWRGLSWAPRAARWGVPLYILVHQLDQLFLASDPLTNINRPFEIGASIFILILPYWILSRQEVRGYFGEFYE